MGCGKAFVRYRAHFKRCRGRFSEDIGALFSKIQDPISFFKRDRGIFSRCIDASQKIEDMGNFLQQLRSQART